jgi:hypothetical protein
MYAPDDKDGDSSPSFLREKAYWGHGQSPNKKKGEKKWQTQDKY